MTQTFEETISETKNNFLDAKRRLIHAFETTPDDRVDWSPSPTARTPAQIVGHAAEAIKNLKETLNGHPFEPKTTAEAEVYFRAAEKSMTGREVLATLEKNSSEYVAWLDGLTPERLDTLVKMPFGFGELPVRVALVFPHLHTLSHVPQIEYIQTIYGDRDWHL